MSDLLNQAKAAANSALTTAQNLASQASESAQPTLQSISAAAQPHIQNLSAAAQPHLANLSSVAQSAGQKASELATQAQGVGASYAPGLIPSPTTAAAGGVTASSMGDLEAGVDRSETIAPGGQGAEKLDNFLAQRPDAEELMDQNILKGSPDDPLAGKRADLLKAQLEDKLDGEISTRPEASELVQKGILKPDEAPPTI